MEQCRNSRSELLLSVGVNVIPTCLQIFEFSIPKAFIKEVAITQTNKSMAEGGRVFTYGEFLVRIGLWFMMATIQSFQRRDFWSNSTMDPFETASYHFNNILPHTRFEEILRVLTITDEPPPE